MRVPAPYASELEESRIEVLLYSIAQSHMAMARYKPVPTKFQLPAKIFNIMAPSLEEVEYAVSTLPLNSTSKQTNGVKAIESLKLQEDEKLDLVLRVYRCLIADLCEQFKGGHPG